MAVGAGILVASVLGGLGMVSIVLWAAPVAAQSSCDTSTPVVLSYSTVAGAASVMVSAVHLSGLPAGCDGGTVIAQLYGNSAGDPSVAKASDQLLSTVDSTLDPCTRAALSSPGVVTGGTIGLPLCPSGGAGGDVSVHDLTLVEVSVNGLPVPVALAAVGGQSSGEATHPVTNAASETKSGGLAFTGADLLELVSLGLLLLLAGVFLAWLGRRRSQPDVVT